MERFHDPIQASEQSPSFSTAEHTAERRLQPPASARGSDPQVERIGLQLYTLREELSQDFDDTLARVAALGFQEMEFAGYYDRSAAEIKKALDDNGLSSPRPIFK